jgi:hypothetical protein
MMFSIQRDEFEGSAICCDGDAMQSDGDDENLGSHRLSRLLLLLRNIGEQ